MSRSFPVAELANLLGAARAKATYGGSGTNIDAAIARLAAALEASRVASPGTAGQAAAWRSAAEAVQRLEGYVDTRPALEALAGPPPIALSPVDGARAVLLLARLIYLHRRAARERGSSISGPPNVIADVGRQLARDVAAAETTEAGSDVQREALVRVANGAQELSRLLLPTDTLASIVVLAEAIAHGQRSRANGRPPKGGGR